MSNGRLKAATNRVRTSIALQANSMWTNTIGQAPDAQAGSNSAIEAALNAPTHGGGRKARQQAAANVVAQTDGFNTAVHSYESLLSLARSQGAVGGQNRGACRVCGQLGHLTKQCRNMQSTFFKPADAAASGTTNGKGVSAEALEAARANLLVLPDSVSDLESELSDSDSSSSSSDSEDERRRKEKKRKRKERKQAAEKRKRKKDKKHKKKRRKKSKSSSSGSGSSDSE